MKRFPFLLLSRKGMACCVSTAAWLLAVGALAAEPPAPLKIVSLAVYPPQVKLNHAGDSQRMIAVAMRADGVSIDVTDAADWQLIASEADADAIQLRSGKLRAARDGLARLRAEYAGLTVEADAHAIGIEAPRPVSYRHDVMPVLMRAGCNAGGCHGSSRGKDGFMLSLFGYDPAGDHHRLTQEMVGRRLNHSLPQESLLLTKATAAAPHTGGKRIEPGSDHYAKLLEWIECGALNDVQGAPTVDKVYLYPPAAAMESGGSQQFIVVAKYSDGSTRDVTELAIFLSGNEATAAVDPSGLVTTDLRGEAFVMARFDTHTVGSQVLSLPTDASIEPITEQPANYIDTLVNDKLRTMRIAPSDLCSDEVFLRRVTVDIAGELPTAEERAEFLANSADDKRAQKIDELLQRAGFSNIWASKWADLLMVRTEANRVDYKPMFLYSEWLRGQIEAGRPLDEMVRQLLAATGSTFDTPQTNFYQIEPDPKKTAENVAQSLLGVRLQCAQCHNHPFDRWTMDDYYAFTAFFTQVGRKRSADYREWVVFDRRSGEARHPVGNRVVKPKFLGDEQPDLQGQDRRAVIAKWITSPENPYFATSVANRVWAHFFGVGIVEPVDDIRVSNPPSNPELFQTLGDRLAEYRYDLRQLVRDICNSNTYQRSSQPTDSNQGDARNFARSLPRRMPAPTLLDCIGQATGSPEKLPGLPIGAKATEIADGRASTYFLTTFGKAKRDTVCACESATQPTLSQALHLINGNTTNRAIVRGKLIRRWLKDGMTPAQVIDAIYIRCLTREATPTEHEQYSQLINEQSAPSQHLEDIFWAVLNSREFSFNH